MSNLQTLPGFREFYPETLARRQFLFQVWRRAAHVYGFQEYDAPVLEPLDLFKVKSGEEIEAQLFSFTDKGGREVSLRPEMTPGLARMVGAKANSLKRPIKWFSIGEHFRYERQQKGRTRSFFQLNADIFGEAGPAAELELIALLIQSLVGFGLTDEDFFIRLSDRDLWVFYLRHAGYSEEQVAAILTVVDKLERETPEASKAKLTTLVGDAAEDLYASILRLTSVRSFEALENFLADQGGADVEGLQARLQDWRWLLDGFEAMGLGKFISIDLGVVRGLAYYTGFVFEAFDRKGQFRAIAGGGRYNHLVAKLGGPDLPAVGFGMGDVVLGELLAARGLMPEIASQPDVYLIIGGADERKIALGDLFMLRQAGYRVDYPLRDLAFGKQFKQAGASGARLALIYGGEEVARNAVKIRDLSQGTENEVPAEALLDAVRAAFSAD